MTTEQKTRIIGAKEWAAEKPYYISIHSKYWSEIKLGWKKSCRMLNQDGRERCETHLDSVDSTIQALEGLIKSVMDAKK